MRHGTSSKIHGFHNDIELFGRPLVSHWFLDIPKYPGKHCIYMNMYIYTAGIAGIIPWRPCKERASVFTYITSSIPHWLPLYIGQESVESSTNGTVQFPIPIARQTGIRMHGSDLKKQTVFQSVFFQYLNSIIWSELFYFWSAHNLPFLTMKCKNLSTKVLWDQELLIWWRCTSNGWQTHGSQVTS